MGALRAEKYFPNYTYDEYKEWKGRWEIIDGVAYAMSPMATPKHQRISNNIGWQLNNLLKDCQKCKAYLPVDWKISNNTVVQPDNLVLCYEIDEKPYITKAPSIIFEVLSKSTAIKDLNLKYQIYESEGVEYYITVSPDSESAKVFKLKDYKYVKIADATDDKIELELDDCKMEFDFSLIWE